MDRGIVIMGTMETTMPGAGGVSKILAQFQASLPPVVVARHAEGATMAERPEPQQFVPGTDRTRLRRDFAADGLWPGAGCVSPAMVLC